MKLSDIKKGMLYAALKFIEQTLEKEASKGQLPPGFSHKLEGLEIIVRQGDTVITITPPANATLEREAGRNGDGMIDKRATQRLFGTAILAESIHVLQKFNQDKRILKLFWMIVKRSIRKGNMTQDELKKEIGKEQAKLLEQTMEEIRAKCPVSPNATPRRIVTPNSKATPSVTIS